MPSNLRKTYPLHQSPFYRLFSKRKLAEILGIPLSEVTRLSKTKSLYKEWDYVNKKGKKRRIEEPCHELKKVQKRVADLLGRIEAPDFLFCPVKGRSYISNAHQHAPNAVVRSLDIKSFFPSVLSRRIYWFFHKRMGSSPDVAGILTSLSTLRSGNDRHLPTGSPSSPILSYYACQDMWEAINAVTQHAGCTLTVYVDDITISGPKVPERVMWDIKNHIHSRSLQYHKEKHYHDNTEIREVTGVIINKGKLNLPNRHHQKIHKLCQLINTTEEDSPKREKLIRQRRGRQAQAQQITAANN